MGFRLAPCLVLWDLKTDGWPPVPIPKPSPRPRAPWIELRLALAMLRQRFDGISAGPLSGFMWFQNWRMPPCPPAPKSSLDWAAAGFSHAAAMVWWDFGWPPVWYYGISKLTDGPLFDGLSAGPLSGLMGFQNWRMAPCLMGFRLAPLSGFMGFQNWRIAPCPDPKALPAPKSSLDWAAAGFSHAAAMVWWAFGWPLVWFYGVSKLTDSPLSWSQSPPRAQEDLGLSCGWL